jgi:hypothetical protein
MKFNADFDGTAPKEQNGGTPAAQSFLFGFFRTYRNA